MNGSTATQFGVVGGNAGPAWQIKGTGDFYGNGTSDVVLQNSHGQIAIWDMHGATINQLAVVPLNPGRTGMSPLRPHQGLDRAGAPRR